MVIAKPIFNMHRRLFSRENLCALLLCLLLVAIVVLTADQAPQWIYQGF
ncbi:MAG: hypothetical protein ACWGO1_02090 [Anaerolineales bacterium]